MLCSGERVQTTQYLPLVYNIPGLSSHPLLSKCNIPALGQNIKYYHQELQKL